MYFLFIQKGEFMNQEIFGTIFELILSGGITVMAYFLKRTISELDCFKNEVSNLKEHCIKRNELDECKKDISRIKENYLTREDFFREQETTRRQLDKIMNILLEMKGDGK